MAALIHISRMERVDEDVGTPRGLGLQSVQSFEVIESVGNFTLLTKNELLKSIERYELINRKINYCP